MASEYDDGGADASGWPLCCVRDMPIGGGGWGDVGFCWLLESLAVTGYWKLIFSPSYGGGEYPELVPCCCKEYSGGFLCC